MTRARVSLRRSCALTKRNEAQSVVRAFALGPSPGPAKQEARLNQIGVAMITTALMVGTSALFAVQAPWGVLAFLGALGLSAFVYALLTRPPYEYPAIKALEADLAAMRDKVDRAILTGGRRGN